MNLASFNQISLSEMIIACVLRNANFNEFSTQTYIFYREFNKFSMRMYKVLIDSDFVEFVLYTAVSIFSRMRLRSKCQGFNLFFIKCVMLTSDPFTKGSITKNGPFFAPRFQFESQTQNFESKCAKKRMLIDRQCCGSKKVVQQLLQLVTRSIFSDPI